MKTILIILFLFGGTLSAQTYQFKAEYVSIRAPFDSTWNDWSESQTRIAFFEEDSVISIFAIVYREFYMIVAPIQVAEYKEHPVIRFICVDEDNQTCFVEVFKHEKDIYHIYFRWSWLEIVYQVKKI